MNFPEWLEKRGVWPILTYEEIWNAAIVSAVEVVEAQDCNQSEYQCHTVGRTVMAVQRLVSDRDQKYSISFENSGQFITASSETGVYVRCPSGWTDLCDNEDLRLFIIRHQGTTSTAAYLVNQYKNRSKLLVRDREYFIYMECGGNFITSADDNTAKVSIRCPSDWTDIGDDEDLNVFVARHGGSNATTKYLLNQMQRPSIY